MAEKEAGVGRPVNLTVINQRSGPFELTLCEVEGDGCRSSQQLQPGQSYAITATGGVRGSISAPDAKRVDFNAQNPFIGRPYVTLESGDESERLDLDEGESARATLGGYSFLASRATDDDNKQIRLAVEE